MYQWRFLVDASKCIGCRNCEMACRSKAFTSDEERLRWVRKIELADKASGICVSLSCNHCESPECFRVCPEGAYRKRRDGIVIHDPRRCSGCGDCFRGCPFGAVKFSLVTGKVAKCNLCVERVDEGLSPICVEACPTEALKLLNPKQRDSLHSKKEFQGFGKTMLTRPATRFLFRLSPQQREEDI